MTTKEFLAQLGQAIAKGTGFKGVEPLSNGVKSGTPVNAVAAAKVLTVGDIPTAGETVSIGGKTYMWVSALVALNDVLIGVSAEASINNMVAAINGAAGAGTTYKTGTVKNAFVTAAKASASTMSATAKTKGVIGNSVAIAEDGANTTWASSAVFLSGGVDGTEAVSGQVYVDSTHMWIAKADNTTADANWVKCALA
jgi:hypothetical protein